jgi:hypothetical protein
VPLLAKFTRKCLAIVAANALAYYAVESNRAGKSFTELIPDVRAE